MMRELYLDARRGFPTTVKCPKCGFVSFPGHEQCKKCGHRFTQVNGQVDGIPPLFQQSASEKEFDFLSKPEDKSPLDQTELGQEETSAFDVALEPQGDTSPPAEPEEPKAEEEEGKPAEPPSNPEGLSPWQAELAERVQEYRQRRAHLRNTKNEGQGGQTLEFGFGGLPPQPEEPRPNVIEFPSATEAEKRPKPKPGTKSAPPSFGMGSFESAFRDEHDAVEFRQPPSPPPPEPRIETGPLEIELGPSGDSPEATGEDSSTPIASMGTRFYAAVIDSLVLLAGAAIYGLIYWKAGGSFSPSPLDLATGAAIGAFFILAYFAGCTAMASATPGLLLTGLEVITFEGNPPGISHSLWRGLGYLVSMAALMLGFIWAVVDAEGLTWHDRMSRTFVVPAERP